MAAVEVIIPLFNKADTVEKTIRSIQSQTFTDWNIIVVDDGSTDDGPDRVQALQDARIRLISQSNQGPGAARNTGIRAATAPYVAFLDADDEWCPWYLENAMKAIQDNPVSFVGSMYYIWPHEKDMTSHWKRRGIRPGTFLLQGNESASFAESLVLFYNVWATLVRREKALQYNGFYEEKCICAEDTIFFARLVFNEPMMVIGPAAVRHNLQHSSLSHNLDHPIAPFLTKPEIILDYCPPKKKALAEQFICRFALRTVHHLARNGYQVRAAELLKRFPCGKQFPFSYYRYKVEICLSPILPLWVRFKCFLGISCRLFIKKMLSIFRSRSVSSRGQSLKP